MNECLKQLMMALLRAYRFSPIIPDLGFQVGSVSSQTCPLWDSSRLSDGHVGPVFQIHFLRLTTAVLHHERSRKYLLNSVLYPCFCCLLAAACPSNPQLERVLNLLTFDVMRSVVFFYIKTPLRVKEAGLEELILTTWWPTHFDKEVRGVFTIHTSLAWLLLTVAMTTHRGRTSVSRWTRARTSACGGERTSEAARG